MTTAVYRLWMRRLNEEYAEYVASLLWSDWEWVEMSDERDISADSYSLIWMMDDDGSPMCERCEALLRGAPQNVPGKYSLSARAATGILRRAEKRGRALPAHLEEALARVAGTTETRSTGGGTRPSPGRMTTTPKRDGS